ncbi:(E2-independent) E3 ubiquitin-conjugating enzyme FATS isoform X2 [Brachyhypopomus gauderio]|uniref:(E2-independent) E3 ubiquitin-conjugating enzyme FATS isoform X2 n=1 Tax=Brachyhypopomus gauderio TaxID=698409 RepID=UPI0040438376
MAVNKETNPLLCRNAVPPWQGVRSPGQEQGQSCGQRGRVSPSLSSLTCLHGPQKTEAASPLNTPSLSRTLSNPETHLCCSAGPSSGFTSITITARRVSLSIPSLVSPETRARDQRDKLSVSSTMSPCDNTAQQSSVSWGNPTIPLKRQATMVKVTEYRERYYPGERFASSLALPARRSSHTKGKTASQALAGSSEEPASGSCSPSASAHLIFRSCVHLDLLPGSSSSMLYLDKSLSVPLSGLQDGGRALHRSTLTLYLREALRPRGPERLEVRPLSGAHGHIITRGGRLEGVAAPYSAGGGSGSESSPRQVTLSPLPFRARRRSSPLVFRLNGKANDVSQPRTGSVEGPEFVINKSLVSPAVIRNSSAVDSVRCHSQKQKTQNYSHSQHAALYPSSRMLVNSGVSVRTSTNGRGPCSSAEPAVRGHVCPVSPHVVLNYTIEPNGTNQPQALSLKEALEHFRPDFISRSQRRVRQLEERARRRQRSQTAAMAVESEGSNKRQNCTKPHPLSDNLFKPKDRLISGKEMQLRSKRIYNKLPEVTKKKEEERRRLVQQTNRLRAEVFKKKLLDQVLQRNGD